MQYNKDLYAWTFRCGFDGFCLLGADIPCMLWGRHEAFIRGARVTSRQGTAVQETTAQWISASAAATFARISTKIMLLTQSHEKMLRFDRHKGGVCKPQAGHTDARY